MEKIKVVSINEKGNRYFDCGCCENAYWCGKHDIYGCDAMYAPWGRNTTNNKKENELAKQSETEDFYNERPDDFDDEDKSCSCHINPPCSKCCP